MTYKQTLFFVSKCLTITLEEKNKECILKKLKAKTIDWEKVVKLSTSNYVLSALYCNLKRVNFLKYIPDDLVIYMKYITELNKQRNLLIIKQAKELNKLLLNKNLTPVFIKGTGNIIQGLYKDICERMIGDIDIICSEKEYPKVVKIMLDNGYEKFSKEKNEFPLLRHYPRLVKKNCIAAVEVHNKLIVEKNSNEFNLNLIYKNIQKKNNFNFLGYYDQILLSILSHQVNDNGYELYNVNLRNIYDVYLLSKKTKIDFSKFNILKYNLDSFMAVSSLILGGPSSLNYNLTEKTEKYLAYFNFLISNDKIRILRYKIKKQQIFIRKRLLIIYKSLFDKNSREWLKIRIINKLSPK